MALFVRHDSSVEHDTGAHPENRRRTPAIEAAMDAAGWPGVERVEAIPATPEQVMRVHPAEHVQRIEGLSAAASPPCAQKLALSVSGVREMRQTRPPISAACRAVHRPAAPPPTTATSKASLAREVEPKGRLR